MSLNHNRGLYKLQNCVNMQCVGGSGWQACHKDNVSYWPFGTYNACIFQCSTFRCLHLHSQPLLTQCHINSSLPQTNQVSCRNRGKCSYICLGLVMRLCVSILTHQIVIAETEGFEKLHRQIRNWTHNCYKTTSCDTFLGLTTHYWEFLLPRNLTCVVFFLKN